MVFFFFYIEGIVRRNVDGVVVVLCHFRGV